MATSKYRRAELEFDTDEVDLDGFSAGLGANSVQATSGDLTVGCMQMAGQGGAASFSGHDSATVSPSDNSAAEVANFDSSADPSIRVITLRSGRWSSAATRGLLCGFFKPKLTNREKCMMLFCVCLLLAMIFLLVLLGNVSSRVQPRTRDRRLDARGTLCTNSACIQASSRILSAYDASNDRCNDYYSLSCGNYVRTTFILPGNAEWNRFSELQQDIFVECFSLVEQLDSDDMNATISEYEKQPSNHSPEDYQMALLNKNVKTFMKACMSRDRFEALRGKPLLRVIEQLGGWNILSDPLESFNINASSNATSDKTVVKDVEQFLSALHRRQSDAFLSFTFSEDAKNSSYYVLSLDQGGIRLPSREFYLQNTSNFIEIRAAYKRLIVNLLQLLRADYQKEQAGVNEELEARESVTKLLGEHADWIIRIETALAGAMLTAEERRDDLRVYNRMTLAQFSEAVATGSLNDTEFLADWLPFMSAKPVGIGSKFTFNWAKFLGQAIGVDLNLDEPLVVTSVRYFVRMTAVLNTLFDPSLRLSEFGKSYALWQMTGDVVWLLAADYRDAANRFRGVLLGVEGVEPTWKDCMELLDTSALGNILSALYLRSNLGYDSRNGTGASNNASTLSRSIALAERMTLAIRSEFERSMNASFWLDEPTARAAIDKLNAIKFRIGYPNYLLNVSDLFAELAGFNLTDALQEDTHFENMMKLANFSFAREMRRYYDRRINRSKWDMTPITVNAYYSPTANEIVIPAGILQPPFFSPDLPAALNYGALGVVIGHELQHAFDDEGSQFDADGNLNEGWWSNRTRSNFEGVLDCFAKQYDDFITNQDAAVSTGNPSVAVNATSNNASETRLTLGENLADSGGLIHSFRAFERLDSSPKDSWPAGLSSVVNNTKQLFFAAFANMWCSKSTRESNLMKRFVEAHSSAQYRVLGTLRNSIAFRTHFGCDTLSSTTSSVSGNSRITTGCSIWPSSSDSLSTLS